MRRNLLLTGVPAVFDDASASDVNVTDCALRWAKDKGIQDILALCGAQRRVSAVEAEDVCPIADGNSPGFAPEGPGAAPSRGLPEKGSGAGVFGRGCYQPSALSQAAAIFQQAQLLRR